jgi:hypothetical protein
LPPVTDETAQRRWQRTLAEYAIARAEHQIACFVLSNLAQAGHVGESPSPESLAEQRARDKLHNLRDQIAQLEADSALDAVGAIADPSYNPPA